jgi:8-oxo-dGTP pyrophosphatase MutT (NUDIX family)
MRHSIEARFRQKLAQAFLSNVLNKPPSGGFFTSNSGMAISFNPHLLPALRVDSHLPAVAPKHLHPQALAQRFRCPPDWQPEILTDGRVGNRPPAFASVLMPLVLRSELTVLLTRRTDHLTDHAGQISFPGGRAEPEDEDAVATALREAGEEIGLRQEHVQVIGQMPTYTTVTGFVVTPVVALVDADMTLQADPFEVAEIFEVPLAFLTNPAHHRHHAVDIAGVRREFLSMPWPGHDADPARYFIWGATAAMLRNLYRFLMS